MFCPISLDWFWKSLLNLGQRDCPMSRCHMLANQKPYVWWCGLPTFAKNLGNPHGSAAHKQVNSISSNYITVALCYQIKQLVHKYITVRLLLDNCSHYNWTIKGPLCNVLKAVNMVLQSKNFVVLCLNPKSKGIGFLDRDLPFATPSAIKNVVSMKVEPDLFWVNALVTL